MNTKPYHTMSAQYMLVTMYTKTQTVYKKPQACLISQLHISAKKSPSPKNACTLQPKDQEIATQTIVMLDCSWQHRSSEAALVLRAFAPHYMHSTVQRRQNVADRPSLTSL
ncbi:TPA: hypothetical protein ACH3X2_006650 [Trebouxia sp. C0005]